jgi:hypothetical protein
MSQKNMNLNGTFSIFNNNLATVSLLATVVDIYEISVVNRH